MSTAPDILPPLAAAAAAHAARVLAAVRAAIATAGGALAFDDYMELALYAPGLGYYAAGARKLGGDGDFITAPEVSPLFGRALARQVAEVAHMVGGDTVLELGPGSGALAAALLPELARLGAAPARYLMLEPSPDLRDRQRARLAALSAAQPALTTEFIWLDRLPERPIVGTILANEVLDALPCERFVIRDGAVFELVVVAEGATLTLAERPARAVTATAVRALEQELGAPFADGFAHEHRTRLAPFVSTLGQTLDRGLLLLIDYGLGQRELYHPSRDRGTLRVHHRHRVLDDALFRPGLCDLTAWVDFTAAAAAGVASGLTFGGFTTQAQLLLGCGLTELLAEPINASEGPESIVRARRSRDAQLLTLPDEMGERFKALALTRGEVGSLCGFSSRDLSHTL